MNARAQRRPGGPRVYSARAQARSPVGERRGLIRACMRSVFAINFPRTALLSVRFVGEMGGCGRHVLAGSLLWRSVSFVMVLFLSVEMARKVFVKGVRLCECFINMRIESISSVYTWAFKSSNRFYFFLHEYLYALSY